LIRSEGKRKKADAIIRSIKNGVEAEYHESDQSGLIMKLLSPGGKIISYGRFILPGIAQLEYRGKGDRAAYITAILTPTKKGLVKAHIIFTYNWGALFSKFSFLVKPLFRIALKQDIKILNLQTKNVEEHEKFSFVSTPLDLLGPKIRSLLKAAKSGENLPTWKEKKMELLL
jgi:hypothetical protein